ncbi:MAG: TIGR03960 family B12-binding radical SAM protein [Candidatus Omnitrophica bacterium]|nr:TIGR03960 family B12-binding radical SAM protein [Candidatus Omnitrophota bacterium]
MDIHNFLFNSLLSVTKPARYIGKEINQVVKDFDRQDVKFALCFPDIYEVGMSHLGFKIIYGILNSLEGVVCERVFSPWGDFEELLIKNSIEIFSLESKRPLRDFDIIGFSISHELNYTNVLNILKLANIRLRSTERNDNDPLIIAGGYSCFNPEPIADFIDAFVIGEAEEVILEIIDVFRSHKCNKDGLLKELASLEGVYVPVLYEPPKRIRKRIVSDFNNAYYPVKQIVPYISIIHDRISMEIMRGCVGSCRFCQAGMLTRPVRLRSPDKILELVKDTYISTGYEEISLVSLSSIDHPSIKEIIAELNKYFSPKGVGISLPSLRIENALKDIPLLISKTRKTTLTFAPEAGTERLLNVINKNIEIDGLFIAAEEAFRQGWRHLKLYFMIGLPTEKEEDLQGIVILCRQLSQLKKKLDGHPAGINISLSSFIPKPHTPFQWEKMEDISMLKEKARFIKNSLKSRLFKVDVHNIESSFLEAVFSRGDKILSRVILTAFNSGCRFDNWTDKFDFNIWMDSFKKEGINPHNYLNNRTFDDMFSWDIIDTGVSKDFLMRENMLAKFSMASPGCELDACKNYCNVCGNNRKNQVKVDLR